MAAEPLTPMRVLIVEDSGPVASSVRDLLLAQKFAVDVATDGAAGLDCLLRGIYDVAVVDVGLPKQDGFAVAKDARSQGIATPILMLTARDAVEDRVSGFSSGADDYLIKPFHAEELVARIHSLVRRGTRPLESRLECGPIAIDVTARVASCRGTTLDLGATEFRLLEFFVRNRQIAFTRAQLLERLWEYDFEGSPNIVDVYVSRLRRKLKDAGAGDSIETVWGVGYKLVG